MSKFIPIIDLDFWVIIIALIRALFHPHRWSSSCSCLVSSIQLRLLIKSYELARKWNESHKPWHSLRQWNSTVWKYECCKQNMTRREHLRTYMTWKLALYVFSHPIRISGTEDSVPLTDQIQCLLKPDPSIQLFKLAATYQAEHLGAFIIR